MVPLDVAPDEAAALLDPAVEVAVPELVDPDDVVAALDGAPVVFCGVPVVSDCWFSPELVLEPLDVPFAMASVSSSRVSGGW